MTAGKCTITRQIKLYSFLCTLFILLQSITVRSQVLPPAFAESLVSNNWTEIAGLTFDSTGQMYVWERAGIVWVIDTNGVKLPQPLLDIHDEVGNWRDHGFNGFCLDPNFRTNGYFYTFYAVDRFHLIHYGTPQYSVDSNAYYQATIARVTRFTANAVTNFSTVVPNSRLVLIGEDKKTGVPITYENHSGGALAFGTDGTLFVSTGDGGSAAGPDTGQVGFSYWAQALMDSIIRPKENIGTYRSQLIDCLNGKILRIDPATGDGLPSNPFYDSTNARAPRSRVWSVGLRNPFRITLRPGTGETDPTAGNPGTLYIGDVGWQFWEDVQVANKPGQNFGWPVYQGLQLDPNYAGAKQYNFDAPNPLFGVNGCNKPFFTFHDLLKNPTANGIISYENPCDITQQIPPSVNRFVHSRPIIDYSHGNESRTGIYNGNDADVIDIDAPLSPVNGVRFGGYCSIAGIWCQSDKWPVQYQNNYFHADFASGWIKQFNMTTTDTATFVGNFADSLGSIVCMVQKSSDGCIYYINYPDQIRKICYTGSVNNPPKAIAIADTTYGASPLTVNFTGSQSTDPENDSLLFFWDFGDGFTSTAANPGHVYTVAGGVIQGYWALLTVSDTAGNSAYDSVFISINNTPPIVDITSFNNSDLYSMAQYTNLPLQATVTDAEHLPGQLHYRWEVFLGHNTHVHPEPVDTNRVTSTLITPIGCNGEYYYYKVRLTVTDDGGLSGHDEGDLFPNCNIDCHGDLSGTAFIDSCGICAGGNTGVLPCTRDCNNDYGGTAYLDSCGVCVGGSTGLLPCVQDCHGDFGGTAYLDSCGICVGGNTGLFDCDTTTGLSQVQMQQLLFSVSPNPVHDNRLIISAYSHSDTNFKLAVTDITGKIILSGYSNFVDRKYILNIEPITSNGYYFITLSAENKIPITKSFVVSRK